jgi:ubiquinone/menaquinone biosynthesis C-methylase UbiE
VHEVPSKPADDVVGAHYAPRSVADGLARLYDEPTPLGDLYRTRMHHILELVAGRRGRLLDAGCGTGQMLGLLRDAAGDRFALTGLDRSAAAIELARETVGADGAELVVGRIEELPFPAASFDVVLAMGSLEYVADLDRSLAELARVSAPGGLVVLTMQNPRSPYRAWERAVWTPVQRRRGIETSPVLRRVPLQRLRGSLQSHGLRPTTVLHYNFNVCMSPIDSRAPQLARGIQRVLAARTPAPLRWIAADYIVAALREADGS